MLFKTPKKNLSFRSNTATNGIDKGYCAFFIPHICKSENFHVSLHEFRNNVNKTEWKKSFSLSIPLILHVLH